LGGAGGGEVALDVCWGGEEGVDEWGDVGEGSGGVVVWVGSWGDGLEVEFSWFGGGGGEGESWEEGEGG